uniref:Uncharacterized protein n=1 Tax=Dunaliella tertiolecta TaxID=3047 RepID=A0A7S3QNU9_DUNTE
MPELLAPRLQLGSNGAHCGIPWTLSHASQYFSFISARLSRTMTCCGPPVLPPTHTYLVRQPPRVLDALQQQCPCLKPYRFFLGLRLLLLHGGCATNWMNSLRGGDFGPSSMHAA